MGHFTRFLEGAEIFLTPKGQGKGMRKQQGKGQGKGKGKRKKEYKSAGNFISKLPRPE
jgi:hypothetical protein